MRLRSLPGLLIVAAFLLFIVPTAVGFYTDWLWFSEIGYEGVFLRSLNAQGLVFALTFGLVFLFLYANLRFARRRTSERRRVVLGTGADGQEISLEGQQIAGLAMPVSIIVALLAGIAGASSWLMWLSYFHAAPFGQTDPLFGREVARDWEERFGGLTAEQKLAANGSESLFGRLVDVEDIAELCCFLLSGATRSVTGQIYPAWGAPLN